MPVPLIPAILAKEGLIDFMMPIMFEVIDGVFQTVEQRDRAKQHATAIAMEIQELIVRFPPNEEGVVKLSDEEWDQIVQTTRNKVQALRDRADELAGRTEAT